MFYGISTEATRRETIVGSAEANPMKKRIPTSRPWERPCCRARP